MPRSWRTLLVRSWLGCVAFVSATVTAPAQSYYYYPSSPAYTSSVGAGSYRGPVYYYWPTQYPRQPVWYTYPNYYYQTAYSPATYQATYTPQTYATAYTPQTDQTASQPQDASQPSPRVTQASYEGAEAQPAAAESTEPAADPYGFTAWVR